MTLGISAARARVSLSALERNIRALGSEHAIDLRRDACGHGLETVAAAARAAGISTARVDPGDEDRARGLGLGIAHDDALDTGAVFGLDGRGTPAMSYVAPVLQTKPLREGDGVSYGYRFRAPADTGAALIAGGYAQGVVRVIGGQASVLLAGRQMPIVGRVAMDVCVVDTGDALVARGDLATYFGAEAPHLISDWTRATGMTALELVAAVGLKNPREVVA